MIAIVPVAGAGTQLRPHTHTQPKPLIPVAGKPILGHIIDNLIAAGVTRQVFIVGYLREKIQEYVEETYSDRIQAEFVVQEPRRGLAHALWVAREVIKDEPELMVILGDTIFDEDTQLIKDAPGSVLAVSEVDEPRAFGIAQLDDDRVVSRLVEKPQIPTSNLALVGMYKITEIDLLLKVLNEMMKELETSTKEHSLTLENGIKEFSLTEALMRMISLGVRFSTHQVQTWFDCGRKQSLLQANRILLGRIEQGNDYRFDHSVIIPPVHIAPGCDIRHSIVGPYVAIGEHAIIRNSIVNNSIVGAYSGMDSIILASSVVGNDTTLRGRANSINIGDNTEIDFTE